MVMADELDRITWQADLLNIVDEPMVLSLIKYRMDEDRQPDTNGNLISSHLQNSTLHAPIIDLDIAHHYFRSSSDGHGHLYIDVPMPRWKMFILLAALRFTGVIEQGNFWWSLRRGGTFVRRPEVLKPEAEAGHYSYGMFFKLRSKQ